MFRVASELLVGGFCNLCMEPGSLFVWWRKGVTEHELMQKQGEHLNALTVFHSGQNQSSSDKEKSSIQVSL